MTTDMNAKDLIFDEENANKGTGRGQEIIAKSLRELGAGRSILIDKHGQVIGGNKTGAAWAEDEGEIIIVKTDGTKLVAVQRTDLDLNDPETRAREMAYADNLAGAVSLEWNADQILSDMEDEIPLEDWFLEKELETLIAQVTEIELEGEGDDTSPGVDDGEEEEFEPSHVRMVSLFFDTQSIIKFQEMVAMAAERFGADNVTDTVWGALKHATSTP